MKIALLKSSNDKKSFKLFETLGADISQISDLEKTDDKIKELIKTLKQVNPYVEGNIFKSVENVSLEAIVAYKIDGVKHSFLETYDEE